MSVNPDHVVGLLVDERACKTISSPLFRNIPSLVFFIRVILKVVCQIAKPMPMPAPAATKTLPLIVSKLISNRFFFIIILFP
jgi:hypothetical protein